MQQQQLSEQCLALIKATKAAVKKAYVPATNPDGSILTTPKGAAKMIVGKTVKPTKRTGYICFSKDMSANLRAQAAEQGTKIPQTVLTTQVAKAWKESTDEVKNQWKAYAEQVNAKEAADFGVVNEIVQDADSKAFRDYIEECIKEFSKSKSKVTLPPTTTPTMLPTTTMLPPTTTMLPPTPTMPTTLPTTTPTMPTTPTMLPPTTVLPPKKSKKSKITPELQALMDVVA